MEKEKSLSQRFGLLRKLPLEVSFQQVEQWLSQQVVFEKEIQPWWWRLMNKLGWFHSDN